MYDELVKRLREADEKSMCGECGLNLNTGATKKGVLFAEAADAIEELMAFARFVAEEVVVDDNEWRNNQNSFPEIACRKLFKFGIVSKDGDMWHYEPPKGE